MRRPRKSLSKLFDGPPEQRVYEMQKMFKFPPEVWGRRMRIPEEAITEYLSEPIEKYNGEYMRRSQLPTLELIAEAAARPTRTL